MNSSIPTSTLAELATKLDGELHYDKLLRILYATDASVYRSLPLAVALPKNKADIKLLIDFAHKNNTSLIPRSAGTSLAGQCVGDGIVVDVSKYMNQILEINEKEQWVRVQPGVIRDELNYHLKSYGLFFGPNTSTSNRCMLGGMVGNNSSGTTSIRYGTTRDHVLELKTLLSDGSEVTFNAKSKPELDEIFQDGLSLESKVYLHMLEELSDEEIQENIHTEFPKASIHRRNTGYAVDELLKLHPFNPEGEDFNLCKLLSGSEGTLAFTTEIKLHVDLLQPEHEVIVTAHFDSINASMEATLIAMKHQPYKCELMDKIILDCTKGNIEQEKNRFFVEGDPAAILCVEFRAESAEQAVRNAHQMINALREASIGYAYPLILPPKTKSVWALRSAGLGLLSNVPGDKKPVACIEDTAVALEDLPAYIKEFEQLMADFEQQSVFYAHAGAGELHLRPILNLKDTKDRQLFHDITAKTAELVKKYQGSLSGEHGDGRVRASFIPTMIGDENYALLQRIKSVWDPNNIFNPGKIVDAQPMLDDLRYEENQADKPFDTAFHFDQEGGILRAVEKCNGSGDCRKLPIAGGTMCPSYQATRNEKDTTRARANALREFLTQSQHDSNPFVHPELKEVMDLCLSCKGCTSECPSNVDMASIKSEYNYQYQKANGYAFNSKMFANNAKYNQLGMYFRPFTNTVFKNKFTSGILKNMLGVHPKREIPQLAKTSLRRWYKKKYAQFAPEKPISSLYFFADEFTNLLDAEIGIKAIKLLAHLNYDVKLIKHEESGRAHISKGFLEEAKVLAEKNINIFSNLIDENTPLIGLEPSAILSFRDEYPRLVDPSLNEAAQKLKKHSLLIDEFIRKEIDNGAITADQFHKEEKQILLHGHCHQKALSQVDHSAFLLNLPRNYSVEVIPSGCCGMAGSFGYEKDHYEVSMKIGSLVLFPRVKEAQQDTIIAAPGTSCRHQIWDGTQRKALHPVEVLWEALNHRS
ncbi:MAG: FAD-linked oxidase C-terminal domain-containing protein [Bacteroidota bacterium]